MILITAFLLAGFAVFLPVFLATNHAVIETVTITVGVTLYHFVMRLSVGTIVNFVMRNNANHNGAWFREKCFEHRIYKRIRVWKWKKYLPTYSPQTFDIGRKTVKELIGATCQAEIVHEVIMALSLLPIVFIPVLGGGAALIITSVLAMLFDFLFVILQRYNRPKLVRVMERLHTRNNSKQDGSGSDGANT